MPKGIVKWFNRNRGYGFITSQDGTDLFVHSSSVMGNDRGVLLKDQEVTFEVGQGKKGPVAVRIQVQGKKRGTRRQNSLMKKIKNLDMLVL